MAAGTREGGPERGLLAFDGGNCLVAGMLCDACWLPKNQGVGALQHKSACQETDDWYE